MNRCIALFTLTLSLHLFWTSMPQARTLLAGPSDFRDSLAILVPGDTLFLQPGDYSLSLRLTDLSGTASAPNNDRWSTGPDKAHVPGKCLLQYNFDHPL
ncbi:MAG: hypothetical protein HKN87_02955 [Saprospiraceae bacterium]|nr:hypothetical protein [Saprospiraceae bacterium]